MSQEPPFNEADLRIFIGPNADYYLQSWQPLLSGEKGFAGLNWAAFAFSGFWVIYRKMYRVAAILWTLGLIETLGEDFIFKTILKQDAAPSGLTLFVSFLVACFCGAWGNVWYFHHAENCVAEIHSKNLDGEKYAAQLQGKGGRSFIALLCFLLIFFTVSTAVFWAAL